MSPGGPVEMGADAGRVPRPPGGAKDLTWTFRRRARGLVGLPHNPAGMNESIGVS